MPAPTFRGGIHPDAFKELSCFKPIEAMAIPSILYLPLSMHWGRPCDAVVKPGDTVKMGQIIADSQEPIPVPIHSPVSGRVLKIEGHESVSGGKRPMIVIENDGQDTPDPSCIPIPQWETMSPSELIDIIRSKGMVGMGGAAFPTHFKLRSVMGKLDTLIINAAECEPYLTCDHRCLLEKYDYLLLGIRIMMRVLGQTHAYLAFEENKADCKTVIQNYMAERNIQGIETIILHNKYPQGYEKQLVKVITGREIPSRALPADVGCAIFNVQTCVAIGIAFTTGMPLISRVVTVSGDAIANPKNLEIRLGTQLGDVIAAAGGFSSVPKVIVTGGPMMGAPQYSPEAVITKATNGVIAFAQVEPRPRTLPTCIRCGKCCSVCPMHLEPIYLNLYYSIRDVDRLERYHLRDCMECGSCAYTCPAHIPLVENFRIAKGLLPRTPAAPSVKEKKKGVSLFGRK